MERWRKLYCHLSLSMAGKVMHHAVNRNMKHISVIVCISTGRESLTPYIGCPTTRSYRELWVLPSEIIGISRNRTWCLNHPFRFRFRYLPTHRDRDVFMIKWLFMTLRISVMQNGSALDFHFSRQGKVFGVCHPWANCYIPRYWCNHMPYCYKTFDRNEMDCGQGRGHRIRVQMMLVRQSWQLEEKPFSSVRDLRKWTCIPPSTIH
jgi:hypothetical protein